MAAVALAACAAAFALTFRFTATTPAALMSGMGAEFFPRLVLGVMAILAVCIALGIGNPPTDASPPVPRIVWVVAGVLLVYVLALEIIGMWLASFLLFVGLGRMWGEKRLAYLALTAAGLLAVIYLVFVRLLKGSFPGGFWS